MKSIAVLSGKGGTGKSTISASLGYILARCGFKTLLVDLDLFTHGITFYALAQCRKKIDFTLTDLFLKTRKNMETMPQADHIPCIMVPNPFTDSNLFVLPSISPENPDNMELQYDREFDNISRFRVKLKKIIEQAGNKYGFEYIIIDTRGGTDHTSTGAALTADTFIMVTEADKPSWEMGNFLMDAIDEMEIREKNDVRRAGFIINKNVLPSKSIERYLRKKWRIPHIGTIPLDRSAIRYFQENKVPVAESAACPFSREIFKIVRKIFVSEKWTDEELYELKTLSSSGIIKMFRRMMQG